MRDSKLLPTILNRSKNKVTNNGFIHNSMPKRIFNSNIDRILNNMISKLPNGNVGLLMVFLNSFCYFLYLIWPRNQMYSFLNNFSFSNFNLNRGYLHTMITCHFSHMSFFSFLIDTGILYLFC